MRTTKHAVHSFGTRVSASVRLSVILADKDNQQSVKTDKCNMDQLTKRCALVHDKKKKVYDFFPVGDSCLYW